MGAYSVLGSAPQGGAKHVKGSLGCCEGAAPCIQSLNEEGVLAPGKACQDCRWGFGGHERLPVQLQAQSLPGRKTRIEGQGQGNRTVVGSNRLSRARGENRDDKSRKDLPGGFGGRRGVVGGRRARLVIGAWNLQGGGTEGVPRVTDGFGCVAGRSVNSGAWLG